MAFYLNAICNHANLIKTMLVPNVVQRFSGRKLVVGTGEAYLVAEKGILTCVGNHLQPPLYGLAFFLPCKD